MTSTAESAIVIGAGLAGLSAAINLARAGLAVTLIEASDDVGGCCSTADVSGYTFNNGALYVAVPSALRAAFDQLGVNFDAEVQLVPIANPHRTILGDGTAVHLSSVEASFIVGANAELRTDDLREELNRLRRSWGPLYRTLVHEILPVEPSLPRVLGRLWKHFPQMGGSVERLITKRFRDPDARAAIASTLLYTGTSPSSLPATQIIGFMALLEEGFHLPRGGMGTIPAALLRTAKNHSVSVRLRTEVSKLVVVNGRLRGVELSTGERIEARQVVASCSGFELATRLLAEDAVPAGLRRRAQRSPLSHRAIAIYCDPSFSPSIQLNVCRPSISNTFSAILGMSTISNA